MKILKSIGGISLLIIAAAGLAYWEIDGRERLLTEDLLVAKQSIESGATVSAESFTVAGIQEKDAIGGALSATEIDRIIGYRVNQYIPENAQITERFFSSDNFFLGAGQSVYVIKPEWISSISSSVRQGDQIGLYSENGEEKIGSFKVAFVKDSTVREVKDAFSEGNVGAEGDRSEGLGEIRQNQSGQQAMTAGTTSRKAILDRTDATSVVAHIEIIADLEEYRRIQAYASGEEPLKILVVQE